MDQRTLEVLEFPLVLAQLAGHASFSLGKERIGSLRPTHDPDEVTYRQALTREARRLIELRSNVTLGGARDVRDLARRCQLAGQLEPGELLDVRSTLEACRHLRRAILPLRDQVEHLADLAAGLPDLPGVEEAISSAIDDSGHVVDHASPALARIRSELKTAHARLMDRLNGLLTASAYRDVIQDPIITVRSGRYVIPIKAEARNKLRSIVHDQSSSGATLFVEPLLTVDLNNRWRELQLAEGREVERILRELSGQIGSRADDVVFGIERLADLDLALACARYAARLNATEPLLLQTDADGQPAEVRLLQARHPLLTGRVVPVTVRIGGEFSALVITGPNTGGKTVALKTVGLLTLMALAGLQIPAQVGSTIRVVDAVYADIGDEQSIEQSLSTFSSHMTHIIGILDRATGQSLVLLDELGAGTDPTEGSALARAILSELVARGTLVVATTHYSELKIYAHTTPGVANASVEFDVETLSPTYRLSIGLPGRSNALAIAARLGLAESLLERARALLSEGDVRVESLLAEIQQERDRADKARHAAEAEHRRVADLARQLSGRLAGIEQEKQRAVEATQAAADAELADVRQRLREVARRVERGEARREDLAPLIQEVKVAERQLVEKRRVRPSPPAPPREPVGPGAWVRVRKLGKVGQVTSIWGDQAEIQLGALKTRVRLDEIERATRADAEIISPGFEPAYRLERASSPATPLQIEVRGWRADQVLPELDRYLNDAYLAGLPFVRIVHGKGTGVLRQVVREHLARHPLVRSFESASQREGGEGVTVASLANS